jgi:replication fork protection complex subunit TIMELESS/Tof1/Swi1
MLIADDPDAIWEIPSSVTIDDLETNIRLLKQFVDEPPVFEDGKSAANLLRRKVVRKKSYSDMDESSLSDSDEESSDKRHGSKKKRKRRELDDEEIEARREKRRLEDLAKRALIKSAVRIIDSDDDSDVEREFFVREAELRERMAKKAMEGGLSGPGTRKARVQKKNRKIGVERDVLHPNSDNKESMDLDILSPASDHMASSVSLDDDSEHDIGRVRSSKKRKIRRAVGISSDED